MSFRLELIRVAQPDPAFQWLLHLAEEVRTRRFDFVSYESPQRTELKLFDRPLGFAEAPSDFANTAFVDETLADHPALNLRKLLDKPKEMNVALDEVQISRREIGLGQGMLKLMGLFGSMKKLNRM